MRPFGRRFAILAGLLAAAVFAGNVIIAQSARSARNQPVIRRLPQSLVDHALAQGRVRAIVGLNVETTPEGLLNAAERAAQRARIAQAQAAILGDLAAFNFGQVKRFTIVAGMALDADLAGLDVLAAHPLVAHINEDRPVPPTLAESTVIVGAPTVWAGGNTGAGEAVAILDTGVERLHPFFGGRVVSEACYSTTFHPQQATSVCPGGAQSATGTDTAAPCTFGNCWHGTHVAGIAGGSGATFHGVARGANIIAIQIFSRFDNPGICAPSPSPCVLSYTSDQILGLERVYDLRNTFAIAAANMSLGGAPVSNQATCDASNAKTKAAIDNLRSVGIATVIAAGNGGSSTGISAPGCISTAVSVGATLDGSNGANPVDAIASFSNSASFLNLLAPGQWITSSVAFFVGDADGFQTFGGTSMAAPHVAGAWTLLKKAFPSATVTQVLNALSSTGMPILDERNGITKPRINVALALGALTPSPDPDGGGAPTPGQTSNPDVPSGSGSPEAVVTLQASAFEPRDVATSFAHDPSAGRWVTGGPSFLYAQLPEIPNGANITQVLFYIEDSDGAADFTGRLCRHWVDSGTGANPGMDCPVNITSVGTGNALIFADMAPSLVRRFDVDGDGIAEDVSYTLSGGWGTSTNGSIKLRQVRLLWKPQVSPAPAFATFADVPVGHPFHRFVEALVASGITGGCGGGLYCPDQPVTRGQMAVFLSAALGLHWPAF